MNFISPKQPSSWYKTLISEVNINTVRGAIITIGMIIAIGTVVNLGIVLAGAAIEAIPRADNGIDVEAIIQVLPGEAAEDDRVDEQEDRVDAIRPRRSPVMH